MGEWTISIEKSREEWPGRGEGRAREEECLWYWWHWLPGSGYPGMPPSEFINPCLQWRRRGSGSPWSVLEDLSQLSRCKAGSASHGEMTQWDPFTCLWCAELWEESGKFCIMDTVSGREEVLTFNPLPLKFRNIYGVNLNVPNHNPAPVIGTGAPKLDAVRLKTSRNYGVVPIKKGNRGVWVV